MTNDNDENIPIAGEEYKKVTEAMYKQNLELARLYKQVDGLNKNLKNLIQQRESLMHLINHKVKGSFTHSKYIFAGLLDGMFGDISSDVKKIAQAGLDSDIVGIRTIDMILNATNLQNGTVSYDMKPVDFKEIVLNTVEERKSVIQKKNLELEMKIKEGEYQMNGAEPLFM